MFDDRSYHSDDGRMNVYDRIGDVRSFGEALRLAITPEQLEDRLKSQLEEQHCFFAGTPIDMADGTQKSIEEIVPGDMVLSYDKKGVLQPGKVKRTFQNRAKHILDFHGTFVTPGHHYYCAEGDYEGEHVALLDIIRSDGAVMLRDGTRMRAATWEKVGSQGDAFVQCIGFRSHADLMAGRGVGGRIRVGTRLWRPDGTSMSILEMMKQAGHTYDPETELETQPDKEPMPLMLSMPVPKPEDYVLKRSGVTLQEIYAAAEWEDDGPRMRAPSRQWNSATIDRSDPVLQAAAANDDLLPNIPHAMRGHPNQPGMTRQQRRARERMDRERDVQQAKVAARERRATLH